MKITWLTYWLAIRRAERLEAAAFRVSPYSVKSADSWHRRMHNTVLLKARRDKRRK